MAGVCDDQRLERRRVANHRLFMGLQLRTHQERLPDGRKVHGYTEKDRTHGGIVIALALCVLLCIALFFGTR